MKREAWLWSELNGNHNDLMRVSTLDPRPDAYRFRDIDSNDKCNISRQPCQSNEMFAPRKLRQYSLLAPQCQTKNNNRIIRQNPFAPRRPALIQRVVVGISIEDRSGCRRPAAAAISE
jgi:hypothetical protein